MNEQSAASGSVSRRDLIRGGTGIGLGLLATGVASAVPASPAHAQQATEQPEGRRRETFDFGWRFQRGDPEGAEAPGFDDSAWADVDLPHDWSIEGPLSPDEPSGGPGGWVPTGVGWYRKQFEVPDPGRDRLVTVEFDGVYQNSTVWINGHRLGHRPYGYVPFAYDLTPHLNASGANVIAVRVDNSRQPNSRWYSGSGIYRHTWLTITDEVHVARWGTQVMPEAVAAESATLAVRTRVENEGRRPVRVHLVTSLLDGSGQTVERDETIRTIRHGDEHTFAQRLTVTDPQLWSVESPTMYTLRSTLQTPEGVVDVYDTPVGIRSASFDADRGLLVNGERVKMNGVNLHHDAGLVGAAVPERVWERRLEILKEMGCNAIRTGHTPYPSEVLALCDRMGFLVMNEVFDEWLVPKPQVEPNGYSAYFDEWYERDVVSVVHRDRNHPSIVIWSAGNEVADQSPEGDPDGHVTLKRLTEVFHREDPTRPVTVGCDRIAHQRPGAATTEKFLEGLDVVGYNYVDRWDERAHLYYTPDREAYPHKPKTGTESRSMSSHHVDVENLYRFVSTHDYVAGDFMWTGFDYLGEAAPLRRGAGSGVLNLCGFKKSGFYFYQSQWTSEPMLHLFPHWNQDVPAGQIVVVRCYTNCESVELFLNGTSLGRKGYWHPPVGMVDDYGQYPPRRNGPRTTSDLHLSWDVPYAPGVLRAVGREGDEVVAEVEVATAGAPAAIQLSADRDEIAADRRDVAHLTAEIVDADGRVVPTARNRVTWSVVGPVEFLGSDNGDLRDLQDYRLAERDAFQGRLLAIVRSQADPGAVAVTATSPGLAGANVELRTVA